MLTSLFKLHATDFDNQQKDDQLFPGRTSDEILKKYPPTVVFTSEFDFIRRDNEAFAERLRKVGKLAEVSVMPGALHCYQHHDLTSNQTIWFLEEEKQAFKTLVDC